MGPNSPYSHKSNVEIKGVSFPVISSDTNLGNMTVRVRADALVPASDRVSTASVYAKVIQKFALNTLKQFLDSGGPVYPASYATIPPTQEQIDAAKPYQTAPTKAVDFFKQVGKSLQQNPLPTSRTGLSGSTITDLPPWEQAQAGATTIYYVPSFGQADTLALFRPIGLTGNGFQVPKNWGHRQRIALEAGFQAGEGAIAESW